MLFLAKQYFCLFDTCPKPKNKTAVLYSGKVLECQVGIFFKEDTQVQEEHKYIKPILRIDARACLNRVYTQCTL